MSKTEIKPPAPGLYIPSQYAINQRINAAVIAERQRVQDYFVERHRLYMAQHIKLNDLALELRIVEVQAGDLSGQRLDDAMRGKTGLLTDKLDEWVRALREIINPDELRGYKDIVQWVSAHVTGIQRTDRNHADYDGGALLRELGRKADAGYGTSTLANVLSEIDRGGAPKLEWRITLAKEIAAMQVEDKTLKYPLAAAIILKGLKANNNLSGEWLYIRDEIQKRNSNRRKLTGWLSDIMADYRNAQLQMSE